MDKKVLEFGNFEGYKLRVDNENSIFLTEWYDQAIMGINHITKSVIYSLDELIQYEIYLRFEEGGLNSEYDDDIDDDVLKVGRDTILRLFHQLQVEKEGVPPTLFEEFDRSIYDLHVDLSCSDMEHGEVADKDCGDAKVLDMQPKVFTHDQIMGIINENEAEYLRWMELQGFDGNDKFELIPRELLDFEDDEEPIIRCVVKLVDEPYWLGFQDLTFDQWEFGKVINQEAA